MRVKDSYDLALQDWMGTAAFDRPEDEWPRKWAEAYVGFCAGEKRSWLHAQGMRWLPNPGWPERGGYHADGHGNSVPRFHITWGTGPGVVEPFERRVREAAERGLVDLGFRHRADELLSTDGAITGVAGRILAPSAIERGQPSDREEIDDFELSAEAVIVTTGGIGGNHELVREKWPERLGEPPKRMLSGVPAHVDGRMLEIAKAAGANEINADRMWHYVEGMHNWDPIWPMHAIRIIPGPSSLWFDARGQAAARPALPRLRHARHARPHPAHGLRLHVVRPDREDHREGVRALGLRAEPRHHLEEPAPGGQGAPEQRPTQPGPGLHGPRRGLRGGARPRRPGGRHERAQRRRPDRPGRARGPDRGPRPRTREPLRQGRPDHRHPRGSAPTSRQGHPRGGAPPDPRSQGGTADRGAAVDPHPQVARRSADRPRRAGAAGERQPLEGLYAAGEVAGFGGGGMHGYRALEGTFLGGCLFSGRTAGRAAARALG